MNQNLKKPTIKTTVKRFVEITIMYVFRANFNDTYYLDTIKIDPDTLNRDQLTWFDPFYGRSKINDTQVAISYCSDDHMIILEKNQDTIKEHRANFLSECILCEDYDSSMMLAAHIKLGK